MTDYTFDESTLSCLYKDARGFRPHESFWNRWKESSADEKQAIWDSLIEEFNMACDEETRQHENAIRDFETRITALLNVGASDRDTAIRWIVESLDLSETDKMYGGSYICYMMGLPYSMEHMFTKYLG